METDFHNNVNLRFCKLCNLEIHSWEVIYNSFKLLLFYFLCLRIKTEMTVEIVLLRYKTLLGVLPTSDDSPCIRRCLVLPTPNNTPTLICVWYTRDLRFRYLHFLLIFSISVITEFPMNLISYFFLIVSFTYIFIFKNDFSQFYEYICFYKFQFEQIIHHFVFYCRNPRSFNIKFFYSSTKLT